MRISKKLLLVLLLLATLSLAACGEDDADGDNDNNESNSASLSQNLSYYDDAVKFRLPAGWNAVDDNASFGILGVENKDGIFQVLSGEPDTQPEEGIVGLISFQVNTSEESLENLLRTELGSLGFAEPYPVSNLTINGNDAARFSGNVTQDNLTGYVHGTAIRTENVLVVAYFVSFEGNQGDIFDAIVGSFTVDAEGVMNALDTLQ